jgi:ParB family chromosome partitioning protein
MDQEIIELNHEECVVWDYADRQDFEMGNIEELAEDIKKNGQIQPIIVREKGYKYEVIAGQRRLRACKILNTSVQAVIRNIDDTDALFVQRSENLKQNISPYSRAKCYGKILKDKKITQAKLAKELKILEGN